MINAMFTHLEDTVKFLSKMVRDAKEDDKNCFFQFRSVVKLVERYDMLMKKWESVCSMTHPRRSF